MHYAQMTTTIGNQVIEETTVALGDRTCTMYPAEHVCVIYDERNRPVKVMLTATEWKLLEVLLRNRNSMVTYRQLTLFVWGVRYLDTHGRPLSHWHICNLRRLIQQISGKEETPIQTVRGFGYKWVTL